MSTEHLTITAEPTGAVRLLSTLQPEEVRHSCFVRDVLPDTARTLAAELLRAADEADATRTRS
ncbi:hypothetical protein GTY67_13480 [Streptomyces sp. SID8374]|uniref:hypothetical protein n=1 Tax=Streptomyces sp. SID8374 TaxID=2690354 RepID=UPI00136E0321|nr:hypothetical protein [Streptomyces sp. SID8374]MYX14408.1 hypothetical protein [Streptomyces sp. SID8374]